MHHRIAKKSRQEAICGPTLRRCYDGGPSKSALLEPLREEAEALPIPVKDLDQISSTTAKAKNAARERVPLQNVLGHHAEAVEVAPHIGHAAREIDAHTGR
jgi:hypothetical protein